MRKYIDIVELYILVSSPISYYHEVIINVKGVRRLESFLLENWLCNYTGMDVKLHIISFQYMGYVGLIAYRYIVFLYITIMYFFSRTKNDTLFREINNKKFIQD